MKQQTALVQFPITIEAKDLIQQIFRNKDFVWPVDRDFAASFLHLCRQEGLTGLIFKALKDSGKLAGTLEPIRTGLVGSRIAGEWIRHLMDTELARVFQMLSDSGIRALLFKGSALAHILYPEPWLRLGCDSDILIRATDREQVENVLIGMGYERHPGISGNLLMKQAGYSLKKNGYVIVLDVHWDFCQAQVLSGLLVFDDLYGKSFEVTGIGPQVRAFSKVDSLILACAHWVGHMTDRKLIWLYDIHLLLESLTGNEQIDFCHAAKQKGVCAICLHTLRQAQKCFGTKIEAGIEAALKEMEAQRLEPSARLIQEKKRADRIWGDLLAVPGWRNKIRLALEHLFPPGDYMRHRYGQSSQLLLPFLYLHRALKGLVRIMR